MIAKIQWTVLLATFPLLSLVGWLGTAWGQSAEVTNEPLAGGRTDYAEAVAGPAEILLARVTLPPGSASGWHSHPGSGWVVVTRGQVSLYGHDGCVTVHSAGTAFREEAGDVHEARNETMETVEFFIAFTVPTGEALLTTASSPTANCTRD
jgi:quercetin dioxygenase-like cupin family protein